MQFGTGLDNINTKIIHFFSVTKTGYNYTSNTTIMMEMYKKEKEKKKIIVFEFVIISQV